MRNCVIELNPAKFLVLPVDSVTNCDAEIAVKH